jgi:hypothetical protein
MREKKKKNGSSGCVTVANPLSSKQMADCLIEAFEASM